MPTQQSFQVSAESLAISRQAHLIRTQQRLNEWHTKLDQPETTQAERELIEAELPWLERQLNEPLTKRTLMNTPAGTTVPTTAEHTNPLMDLVLSLKMQLDEVKAKLKGGHDPLPQSAQAPQDS